MRSAAPTPAPRSSFVQLPPSEPERVALHWCFDSWSVLGEIAVGLTREWRSVFMGDNLLLAPRATRGPKTPWRAVQDAAWAAVNGATGHLQDQLPERQGLRRQGSHRHGATSGASTAG
jgi:hypothetical protein